MYKAKQTKIWTALQLLELQRGFIGAKKAIWEDIADFLKSESYKLLAESRIGGGVE